MADNLTRAQRSRAMSRIRATNTGPEVVVRKALWSRGLRGYRLNVRSLPGRPDVAWKSRRVAVFIDGAFWHGHPSAFKEGKSGSYWDQKIRLRSNALQLTAAGHRVAASSVARLPSRLATRDS